MNASRRTLVANLRTQSRGCRSAGSPFYAELIELMIDDVEAGGPTWQLLAPYADQPFEPVYPLRLLAAVHARVLRGDSPALAAHYPSAGGDGDVAAAWAVLRPLFADPPPDVRGAFDRTVQTNEVGRSVALVGGMLTVAARTRLPLRLREVGASAGLNLRVDRYWYEQDGRGWGDPASPVRFVDRIVGGAPPFGAPLTIADRRGCDRDPLDATDERDRCALLSYVWPGMTDRFESLRAALGVAATMPVTIDCADAPEWIAVQLERPPDGMVTVVYHSIVWQHLDDVTRSRVVDVLHRGGARATAESPLAWLRLEPSGPRFGTPELRLQLWPDGRDELLARAGFHQQPVEWLA